MIAITPWGKAEDSLAILEREPSSEKFTASRTLLDGLRSVESLPGVRKRRIDLEARYAAVRARYFADRIESGDFAGARDVHDRFPLEGAKAEERVRLAALALKVGESVPSLAGISPGDIKWDLRPIYYEAKYAAEPLRETLLLWIQHDPSQLDPHLLLVMIDLAEGRAEAALEHIRATTDPVQDRLIESLVGRREIPIHTRAWLLLGLGRTGAATALLDEILAMNPADEWAIHERIGIAEATHDYSAARALYARLPQDVATLKRRAELGETELYRQAWNLGDIDSGLHIAREFHDIADALLGMPLSSDQAFTLAEIFLSFDDTVSAAKAFRLAARDRIKTEAVVASANAYVNQHAENRKPLLDVLIDIAPTRGYAADPFKLMMGEDEIALGHGRIARPLFEELLDTPLRWKAFIGLARVAMEESAAAKRSMADRLEGVLTQAGRPHWADIRYHSALLSENAGDVDLALEKYDELLAKEYGYRDVAARIERLRKPAAPFEGPRYEILDEGGKARDRLLDRIVRLKSVLESHSIERAAAIEHRNLVKTTDVGRHDGRTIVATEWIEGPTLAERLAHGPLRHETALEVLRSVASALSVVHAHGVAHGSVAAENIIFAGEVCGANARLDGLGLREGKIDNDVQALREMYRALLGADAPSVKTAEELLQRI